MNDREAERGPDVKTTDKLCEQIATAIDRVFENADLETDVSPREIAALALAAVGLDDLDAAVERMRREMASWRPPAALAPGEVRAALEAALAPEAGWEAGWEDRWR